MQPTISDSVTAAMRNIQKIADLMLRSASSPRGARFSLTELFLLPYSTWSTPPVHFAPVPAAATESAAAPPSAPAPQSVADPAPAPAQAPAPIIPHIKLAHTVLKIYESTLQTLELANFVPRTRAADFAAALTSEPAITATQLQTLCGTSNDTASRWLNKAVNANLLRRIRVGKKNVYINVQHFALIQDLPIPLSSIPSATGLRKPSPDRMVLANPSKYLDSYPASYLESITPPF